MYSLQSILISIRLAILTDKFNLCIIYWGSLTVAFLYIMN